MIDKNKPANRYSERGNVFLFILLGVVLFSALAFTVSRGMRSEGTESLSRRQAELYAVDIMAYGQAVARAVDRLRRKSVSETDISFENPVLAGQYVNPNCAVGSCKVFDPQGGGIRYSPPQEAWLDPNQKDISPSTQAAYGLINFTGKTCRESSSCWNDTIDNEDLLMFVPYIKKEICEAINRKQGVNSIPVDIGCSGSALVSAPYQFKGTFEEGDALDALPGLDGGCFQHDAGCNWQPGTYHYFHVLLER